MSHSRRQVWHQKAPIDRWEAVVTVIAQALWADAAATFPVSHECMPWNLRYKWIRPSILHYQGFGSFFSFLEDFSGSLVTSELAVHGRVQILSVFFLNAFQHSEMGIQSPVPTYIPSAAGYVPLLWHPKEPSVEQAWMSNMLMWSGSTFQPRVPDPPSQRNGFLFPQVPLDFRQL